MSLPSNELMATASTEYVGKTTHAFDQPWRGEESTYRFLDPELLRRSRELFLDPELLKLLRKRELQSLDIGVSEDYTLSIGKIELPAKRREVSKAIEFLKDVMLLMPNMLRMLIEVSLKERVTNSLKELGIPVLDVEIRYSEGIGLYALAVLDCDARQALKYWLEIVDRVREYNIPVPVFVTWTGNVNVSPEEMGDYLGRILARMNVFLATREPIDIVKIIREEWGL